MNWDWHFTVNPIFDWNLSDATASGTPDFVGAAKLVRKVAEGVEVGAEYYSSIGKLSNPLPWQDQDNRIYAVVDVDRKPFVFNFGVGRGITLGADKWTLKAIVTLPVN